MTIPRSAVILLLLLVVTAATSSPLSWSEAKLKINELGYDDRKVIVEKMAALGLAMWREDLPKGRMPNVTCAWHEICDSLGQCATVCGRGTLFVDEYIRFGHETQRLLDVDLPLNYQQVLSTHNSLITLADGYGVAEGFLDDLAKDIDKHWEVILPNQLFTATDQFNLGVRMVEIDTHYFDGTMRICHAGGVHLEKLDEFIKFLSKLLHRPIDIDSETLGCFAKTERTLVSALSEIQTWLSDPLHEDEFFIFMFDDQMDVEEWGKVPLILEAISSTFNASTIFTPVEKAKFFPDHDTMHPNWPSKRELRMMGKKVLFVSGANYGSEMSDVIFYKYGTFPHNVANWTELDPSNLNEDCRSERLPFQLQTGFFSRVIAESLVYGPFYNPSINDGAIVPGNISKFFECGINWASGDDMQPLLSASAVWSWSPLSMSSPKDLRGNCTLLNVTDGHWWTAECDDPTLLYPAACVEPESILHQHWMLSEKVPYRKAGSACASKNALFQHPTNAYSNVQLLTTAKQEEAVWIQWELGKDQPLPSFTDAK